METITEDNIHEACSALCHSAMILEKLLAQCFEIHPDLLETVARPNLELFDITEKTLSAWKQYLEIVD